MSSIEVQTAGWRMKLFKKTQYGVVLKNNKKKIKDKHNFNRNIFNI